MKGPIIAVIVVIVLVAAGIFGLPVLIDRNLSGTRQELQDVKQRLQIIEEEAKVAPLEPTADSGKIIKTINALTLQATALESTLQRNIAEQNETMQKQKTAADEAFKKQAETIDKNKADIQGKLQILRFNAAVEDIRGHILKARMEVVAKNLGNAKTEIDFIDELFTKLTLYSPDEQKQIVEEIRASLKKAKGEIESDLPSFINRINSAWYETGRLLREVP